MRIKQAFASGLLAFTPVLSGCLSHTRSVPKTRPPDIVYNATLDQLLNQVDQRYNSLNTATLSVEISASTGGSQEGKVKESLNFSGYIILSKPEDIRVVLLLPVVRSRALDMVSDGKTFKMAIPPRSCAIIGSDVVTSTSQKGLYSLRPAVILDSLMIKGLGPNHVVSMTQDSRIVEAPRTTKGMISGKQIIKGKDLIEEPEYDLQFLSQPEGEMARALRVLHISRINLLPYRQDIYNNEGKVATTAIYSNYQPFGNINFPTRIVIQRPLDELGLTISVSKATFNQKLDPDAFELAYPSTYAVQNMDDPASAATNPCVSHASQSTH